MNDEKKVEINPKTFSIPKWIIMLFRDNARYHPLSPQHYAVAIIQFVLIYVAWKVLRKPMELYYHFKDPLESTVP